MDNPTCENGFDITWPFCPFSKIVKVVPPLQLLERLHRTYSDM